MSRATGVAGYPDDHFWNRPLWYDRWKVSDFSGYLERLRQAATSRNGVFGCKLIRACLGDLLPQRAARAGMPATTPHDVLAATFPNPQYVWLTREDKVRQGISYYRALGARIWRGTDAGKQPCTEPPFTAHAIGSLVQLSTREDKARDDYFQRSGITPLVVT